MTTALWTGLVALILYVLASALAAQQLRSTNAPQRIGFLGLGTLALLFHACALWHLIVSEQGVHLGLFPVTSLIGATGAAIVILSSLYRRLEWVSLMVFPFNAIFIAAALFIKTGYQPGPLAHGIGSHVLFAILAFAVLAIATSQGILVLIQHYQLKNGHIRGVMRLFPPIQVMETMLFELLWAGVILLWLAIAAGFMFINDLFAQHVAHKALFTLISALLFSALLAGHQLLGWRGVTAVRLTVAAFALLLLGFFGSQLVLEVILKR
ncbi:inner membrane protein YpjD [Alcanivorax sp. 1008]|uniref:cytochrome C assembly family protein n=1 Tax=Alcanivorax sp. 1008 TaxID=2816853 RepID=UPI001DF23C61|nr:cytochrome c biogenesis protein CcsA [Alcanivorax sp. 1008]MCC1497271.1 cytochrome c biogenesis protein CcsA [Alcanivorax sp. 1008]